MLSKSSDQNKHTKKSPYDAAYLHGRLYKAHPDPDGNYDGYLLTEKDCKQIVHDFYQKGVKGKEGKRQALKADWEHKIGEARNEVGFIEDLYFNPKTKYLNAVVSMLSRTKTDRKLRPILKEYQKSLEEHGGIEKNVPWIKKLGFSVELAFKHDGVDSDGSIIDRDKVRIKEKTLTGIGIVKNPDHIMDETFISSWTDLGFSDLVKKEKDLKEYIDENPEDVFISNRYSNISDEIDRTHSVSNLSTETIHETNKKENTSNTIVPESVSKEIPPSSLIIPTREQESNKTEMTSKATDEIMKVLAEVASGGAPTLNKQEDEKTKEDEQEKGKKDQKGSSEPSAKAPAKTSPQNSSKDGNVQGIDRDELAKLVADAVKNLNPSKQPNKGGSGSSRIQDDEMQLDDEGEGNNNSNTTSKGKNQKGSQASGKKARFGKESNEDDGENDDKEDSRTKKGKSSQAKKDDDEESPQMNEEQDDEQDLKRRRLANGSRSIKSLTEKSKKLQELKKTDPHEYKAKKLEKQEEDVKTNGEEVLNFILNMHGVDTTEELDASTTKQLEKAFSSQDNFENNAYVQGIQSAIVASKRNGRGYMSHRDVEKAYKRSQHRPGNSMSLYDEQNNDGPLRLNGYLDYQSLASKIDEQRLRPESASRLDSSRFGYSARERRESRYQDDDNMDVDDDNSHNSRSYGSQNRSQGNGQHARNGKRQHDQMRRTDESPYPRGQQEQQQTQNRTPQSHQRRDNNLGFSNDAQTETTENMNDENQDDPTSGAMQEIKTYIRAIGREFPNSVVVKEQSKALEDLTQHQKNCAALTDGLGSMFGNNCIAKIINSHTYEDLDHKLNTKKEIHPQVLSVTLDNALRMGSPLSSEQKNALNSHMVFNTYGEHETRGVYDTWAQ